MVKIFAARIFNEKCKTEKPGSKTSRLSDLGETGLLTRIEKNFKFPKDPRLLLGPGDDCAVVRRSPGLDLVITTDEIVEGTHFLMRFSTPEELAAKLIRINLSDLAAMGPVRPVSCVAGAGLSSRLPLSFVTRFLNKLKSEALRFGITVAGGNLSGARENHFYLTVWGEAVFSSLVTRYGARPGDLLFNIGPLGEAAAGLELLMSADKKNIRDFQGLIKSFWRPEPQLRAGRILGEKKIASAMLDNSDGLARSAEIIAELSKCRTALNLPEEAASKELKRYAALNGRDWRSYALKGGEDFGLVFAVPERKAALLKNLLPAAVCVGRVEKGRGSVIENYAGTATTFSHF
ncbi:MAG TPA: thiamine-phosphate kinase [Elusimicrobia bacterium]|nr:thiamine-phosphate kinase [Elusimicrobiota bacterium]